MDEEEEFWDQYELEQSTCKYCGCCLGSWDDESEFNVCNSCHFYYDADESDGCEPEGV